MDIKPISDKSKPNLISETIIEQIASGTWSSGQKIPGENDLAIMFNVSRTSIRHAISQLVGQGILSVKRGEGTFVNEILPKDFFGNLRQLIIMETPKYLEVQEFRKIIEPSIAYYAAIKANEDDIKALKNCVENQMKYEQKGDMKAYAREDLNFHILLAACVKNSILQKTVDILGELNEAMEHTTVITGVSDGVERHKMIYEGIVNREPEKVFGIMLQHIENNIRAALENEAKTEDKNELK